jgi:hypothetical protein
VIARHLLAGWLFVLPAAAVAAPCPCDCNDDGRVAVNELITGLNIALGSVTISQCPNLPGCGGAVCITSLLLCVNVALDGCPIEPTPTLVPGSATLPALLDAVAPDICAGVVASFGGRITVTSADDSGTISCDAFVGHNGSVTLTRYGSGNAAAAAFGNLAEGEKAGEVAGGEVRNRRVPFGTLGGSTQEWRWLRGCWIATGHTFDDTHFAIGPQPDTTVSLIAASPLFADLLAQCDP